MEDVHHMHSHAIAVGREMSNKVYDVVPRPYNILNMTPLQHVLQYYANGEQELGSDPSVRELTPVYGDDLYWVYPWYYMGYWPPAYSTHRWHGPHRYVDQNGYYYDEKDYHSELCCYCPYCLCVGSGDPRADCIIFLITIGVALVALYTYLLVVGVVEFQCVRNDRKTLRRLSLESNASAPIAREAEAYLAVYEHNRAWSIANTVTMIAGLVSGIILFFAAPTTDESRDAWLACFSLFGLAFLSGCLRVACWNFHRSRVFRLNELRRAAAFVTEKPIPLLSSSMKTSKSLGMGPTNQRMTRVMTRSQSVAENMLI